jgi:ion channel POLLUX/CASTOR
MSSRRTVRSRSRYWFDRTMTHGPVALVGWLALFSSLGILVIAFAVWVFETAPLGIRPTVSDEVLQPGLLDLFWVGLMRTLDPGTMGADHGTWPFLLAMLATTLLGIFAISTLIGVLTSAIDSKIHDLQRGRSHVLERNHTIILGWSPQVFDIVRQVALANESVGKGSIVIMAEQDMQAMQNDIRERVPDLRGTSVICRTGNPTRIGDLDIVNPAEAKSIVILQPEGKHADAHVVKTILALRRHPGADGDASNTRPTPIVADLQLASDVPAVRIVGGDEVCPVVASNVIVGVVLQSCRKSGISAVLQEILDFDGSEVYAWTEPAVVGMPFGEVLFAYDHACPIGLNTPEGPVLNPPLDRVVGPDDGLILIAIDDDRVHLSSSSADGRLPAAALVNEDVITPSPRRPRHRERVLILGWNRMVPDIVRGLDMFLAEGSEVVVVAEGSVDEMRAALPASSRNFRLSLRHGDIDHRDVIEGLDPATYDQIVVLPYTDVLSESEADSVSLVTLLHLRDILGPDHPRTRIVSEMLDAHTRELAEVTAADDFVVSSHLASLMLAQVSENPPLCGIFHELLDDHGQDISLYPASDYVKLGVDINFATVIAAAARRGEVAIGCRFGSGQRKKRPVINPTKDTVYHFGSGDEIIVVAPNILDA